MRNDFRVEPTRGLTLTAERPVSNWLRLNVGLGRLQQRFIIETVATYPISPLGFTPGGGASIREGFRDQLFGSLGLTFNARSRGPFTLLAGLDILTRYNRSSETFTFLTGNRRSTVFLNEQASRRDEPTWVEGVDVIRYNERITFSRQAVPPLTMAVAPRVGVDMQVLDRFSLYVGAVATLGLGPVLRGQGNIDLNGDQVRTEYGHNGSFWGLQVGAKVHLWRKHTTKQYHF